MSNHPEIHPFRIEIPDADLQDLRDRLAHTRWPSEIEGAEWSRGAPVAYLRQLTEYWGTGFDWRVQEARLNRYPQFTTTIDGQNIHFLHVRSPEENAQPLMLVHGWPGSILEFIHLIEPLTNPKAHGGDAADAFHVVIPSIPGFGFSGPTREPGWNDQRVAAAFLELMTRLGYERFGAQGGDSGAIISPEMGRLAPDRLIGVHVNAATQGFMPYGAIDDEELTTFSEAEKARVERINRWSAEQSAYAYQQSTRPQTIAYALADSPIGQLAWIIQHFKEWKDPEDALPEDVFDRDLLLANVSIYWLTNTGGSAANFYYETASRWGVEAEGTPTVPTGVAAFAQDIAIRRYAEAGNNIVHWSDFDRGGHFAALEVPDLLLGDIRTFFRTVRRS